MQSDVLIIGGGPAGMSAAHLLTNEGKKLILVEKEAGVGGLSLTYTFKEGDLTFLTDNGPHRFFSKNQKLYRLIEGLLNEKWIKVNRQTRQFIEGKFYDYPINATQALRHIGPWRALKILRDYGLARVQYGILGKKVRNFEEYIVSKFGRSLGEFNMLNYTEKIWGIPCSKIHPDWAGQRIKGLTLVSAVWSALKRKLNVTSGTPKSLISVFYYPNRGTGLIYDTMRRQIEKKQKVLLNSYPTAIRHKNNRITSVDISVKGKKQTFEPKYLVESVHITDFIKLLSPKPHAPVIKAVNSLKYRSQVYVFLTLDIPSVTKDQWIYFPDESIPFGRISEMRNFSKEMSPKGKTSLFVEYFCTEGDKIWRMNDNKLRDLTVKYLEKFGFIKAKDVRKHYVMRKRNVYPVYDLQYQKHLAVITKYLDGFENLFYIGRPGRFRYNNQDHSIEMGLLAAQSIIDGKKYDIGAVGSEEEYYEKGKVE